MQDMKDTTTGLTWAQYMARMAENRRNADNATYEAYEAATGNEPCPSCQAVPVERTFTHSDGCKYLAWAFPATV